MLLFKIREEQLKARKSKDLTKSNLLTTLLGDILTAEKNKQSPITDAEIVSIIKKYLKNISISLDSLTELSAVSTFSKLTLEKTILENFLPKQLSKNDLHKICLEVAVDVKSFMHYLKTNYAGQYDSKLAVQVANEIFK